MPERPLKGRLQRLRIQNPVPLIKLIAHIKISMDLFHETGDKEIFELGLKALKSYLMKIGLKEDFVQVIIELDRDYLVKQQNPISPAGIDFVAHDSHRSKDRILEKGSILEKEFKEREENPFKDEEPSVTMVKNLIEEVQKRKGRHG